MGKKHYLHGPSMKATRDELKRDVDPADSLTDFYTNAPSDGWHPALRLRFAVIEEAIALLRKGPINHYCSRHIIDYRDTVAWVEGRVESAPSFSLSEISHLLGFDEKKLKDYMRSIADSHREEVAEERIAC